MKIALLLAGRIRGYEEGLDTQFKYIYKNNKTDIFLSHNNENILDKVDEFIKKYNPKKFDSSHSVFPYNNKFKTWPETNTQNTWSSMYHEYTAFKLLEEYIQETKTNYDIVVFSRAELIINNDFNFDKIRDNLIYIPNSEKWRNGICDLFAYGNLQTMKIYCSIFININKYCKNKRIYYHSEFLTKYNLEYNKIDTIFFDMKYEQSKNRQSLNQLRIINPI